MYIQSNTVDSRTSLIGRIKFKNDKDINSIGTGFLVDKDIVITAYHNIKYYDELNKDWKIEFNKNSVVETFSISQIIKSNNEIDIAIIRINKSIEQDSYFEMIDFPILNDFGTLIEDIQVNILGYRPGENDQNKFSAVINSTNLDGTSIVHFNRDMFGESDGLSGAPLVIKEKPYVYGVIIEQYDPNVGLHIKSVINSSSIVKEFFQGTPVKIKKFDSYKLIDKESYKLFLLNEVRNCIKTMYVKNPIVLIRIIRESEGIIKILTNMQADKFEAFINFINVCDYSINRSEFKLDSNYKVYVRGLTEIICHISVLSCKYNSKEVNFEALKPIKIIDNKYLSYIYSFNNSSYMASIVQLFKYIEENPECDLNEVTDILVGNETCDLDCSRCKEPFKGAEVDFDSIVSNICIALGYEEDEKGRLKITDIDSDFKKLNFHCKKCLNFDNQQDISCIKNNITNILGE